MITILYILLYDYYIIYYYYYYYVVLYWSEMPSTWRQDNKARAGRSQPRAVPTHCLFYQEGCPSFLIRQTAQWVRCHTCVCWLRL